MEEYVEPALQEVEQETPEQRKLREHNEAEEEVIRTELLKILSR